MNNLALYGCTVFIWGSTWLAIKFQLGTVAPAVSIAWRFALAGIILQVYARIRRLPLGFDLRTHAWLVLHGILMFGASYLLAYLSELTLPSGLVAVTFSLIVFFNILFLRLFFAVPVRTASLAGAAIGIAGVALLFRPDISGFSFSAEHRRGVAYCLGSTLVASLGNMTATQSHRMRLPVVQATAWSMLYGALFIAAYAALDGEAFAFDTAPTYVVSLLYLAVFGSVIAFVAYLTLMARIGADRASYSNIAIPVVAMLLSTLFEHLRWNLWIGAGLVLCLVGNVMVHWGPKLPMARSPAEVS